MSGAMDIKSETGGLGHGAGTGTSLSVNKSERQDLDYTEKKNYTEKNAQ